MRRKINLRIAVCTAILFSGISIIKAQENYSVASISPEMMKNADAVVRLQEEKFTVLSLSDATYKYRQVVTILNENALHMSMYLGFEDKFHVSHFGKITIYDKEGKKVKNFGLMELKPTTNYSGSNIYDDVYYKYVDPEYMTYPFTAEITYSIDFKGNFSFPDWSYYPDYKISTEKTVFTVAVPANYKLRYYEQNLTGKAEIITSGNGSTYTWKAENIPALEDEPYSISLKRHTPSVFLAPSDFEIGGVRGNAETWEKYGNFISGLNKNKNILEGETVEKVRSIVASTSDTLKIIKELYKYMQNKTRYVSVQIGLGGWQPIEAQKVDQKSYGDCKALSNYMKSLLDIAGIKSYYTLVYAGRDADNLLKNFPSTQFNHAIMCIPRINDTIWLECTSQKIPFNYLGAFTDDRNVLLIKENAGSLAKTPEYTADQNLLSRKATVTIDVAGNGSASISTRYNYYYYDVMSSLLYLDYESQKKAIVNNIEIPGFTLSEFKISQNDPDHPVINEDLSLKLNKYATIMGDRILLPLNLMNRIDRLPSNVTDRKMDINFRRERMLVDTITYKIPAGYSVSSVPQPMEYTSPFAYYRAEVTVKGNEVTYIRKIRYNKGIFPASQYPQLLEFNKSVATADNTKIALKRL